MTSLALILVARPALRPIQIMAVFALAFVLGAFIWILRHLQKVENTVVSDDLVPAQRGPRNNMILMVCVLTLVLVSLLLFLLFKA